MEGKSSASGSRFMERLQDDEDEIPSIEETSSVSKGRPQDASSWASAYESPEAPRGVILSHSSVTSADQIISILEDSSAVSPTHYAHKNLVTKTSSLEMRKMPVNILLRPIEDDSSLGNSTAHDMFEEEMKQRESAPQTLLHKTCLNSRFSLRVQMMLSFGTISSITILVVVVVSFVACLLAGDRVSDITQQAFNDLAEDIAGITAHYLADDLTPRILPYDLVQIIYEATQDRFAGYPIYEDDSRVPFRTIKPGYNQYPLKGPPLPLDWQMGKNGGNVNQSNYYEHVQNRLTWYEHSPTLDTSSAAFYIQGMCDPSAQDPSNSRYFPNCTEANNDIQTGGIIAPASTTAQIHRKASDLNPLLKSLYEYHQNVKNIGLYFANSGAGATVVFPHYELNTSYTYESAGCNWLLDNHPVDPSRTFATLEQFELCKLNGIHTTGNVISSRLYNPLDRSWCREQAMNPNKIHPIGPFQSAWNDQWLMSIGRSVYDRITQDFVACIGVDFSLDSIESILHSSKATNNSEVSVVRFHDDKGLVIASTAWDRKSANGTVFVEELDLGLTLDSYRVLRDLVDYNQKWDSVTAVQAYEQFLLHGDGYLIATYPIPPVPKDYQPDYVPEFLVVVSVAEADFFRRSNDLRDTVEDTAYRLERIILVVGVVGLGMMVVIIFMVAGTLTSPLTYMNEVASSIVQNFGDTTLDDGEAIEVDRSILDSKWVPKTELNDIVKEFLKMVRNFSGSNMAKSTRGKAVEIENRFNLVDEFRDLYNSRSDSKFKYNFPTTRNLSVQETGRKRLPNYRLNSGHNVRHDSLSLSESTINTAQIDYMRKASMKKGFRSPLFFWIVVLIVTPLLLTTITISCILMVNISRSFPDFVDEAKEQYVEEEKFILQTYVGLRANLTAATTERAIRDLHVLTRYMSWLLFGGLNLTDSFIDMTTSLEECKLFENISECPYALKQTCDCTLGDIRDKCSNFEDDSHYVQPMHYACESHDTQPNGDRLNTSFPNVSYSPASTAWWKDVTELPGYGPSVGLRRYESTYERLRSVSGLPVMQPLYRYDEFREKGLFVAFERDGLFVDFKGCKDPPQYATWKSSVGNGAYELRPELCPLGKYGYDPRCRNWYDKGKDAVGMMKPSVFATPPYLFAGEHIYGQSASSPLIEPKSGKHVGNTLVDFVSQPVLDTLNSENFALGWKGFPILITVEKDNFGADAVIGPGLDGEARPIAELVLPHDPECEGAACEEGFFQILESMREGKNGTSIFTRLTADGADEAIHIAYAPVRINTFSSLNSSDFSRGISNSRYLLYSLAFAEYEDAMLKQFYEIEDDIDAQFYITLAVLCASIVCSVGFVSYFSKVITDSMTEPMLQLLELVRTINKLKDGEERPEASVDRQYGSLEVLHVTCTMERLYKVVRSANAAYFSGNVETAYEVLMDALRLFKRLGNTKAIGVASNNLANTLLAAYRILKATKEKRICGFKKREIIAKGTAYFHEAIQQGEKAYDEFYEREGWSPNCLDFMQHLSNRYFNRAMFLLTVKDDHSNPTEIQELGMRDLQISRDMDVEIIDEGAQVGWNVRSVDKTFEVMLSRFRGHLTLLEMGYPDEFELEEWLHEGFQVVRRDLKQSETSALFSELGPVGRMQQIELELMKYYEIVRDISMASKIAIRMLVEDEFTLPAAQLQAVRLLHQYVELKESGMRDDVKSAMAEYLRRVEVSVDEVDAFRANQSVADVMDDHSEGAPSFRAEALSTSLCSVASRDMTPRRRISMRESARGDTTMEMF